MKYLIFTCAILISIVCKAQEQKLAKNGLPLNATSIVLTTTTDKTFASIASILFDNFYDIKYSDKDLGILQTDYRIVSGSWKINLSIMMKDNTVRIQGRMYVSNMIDGQISNYGMKNSMNLLAFEEMQRMAELIPHSKLEYGFIKTPD